jgi:hypothetical protein
MKLSLTRDTLAYQLGVRPALQFRDMSSVPLKQVVKSMNDFMELNNAYDWIDPKCGKTEALKGDPHKDAVIFYLLSHTAQTLRQQYHPLEPLPPKVLDLMDLHAEQMAMRGTRLFYYLLAICTREARHASGYHGQVPKSNLRKKYGQACIDFHEKVMEESEGDALKLLKDSPPDVSVGQYLGYMTEQFKKTNCVYGHAFGGDPWSDIARTAWDFCKGELSLELMMDKAFALEHNTAAIFNKPVLYEYSHGDLKKILDVQRSGQIPQLVYEKQLKCCSLSDVQGILQECRSAVGCKDNEDLFKGQVYVDWYKVEETAAKDQKYPLEKKTQASKYGVPGTSPAKKLVEEVKQQQAAAVQQAQIEALVQVFPKQFIKKYKRVKGAMA